MKLLYRLMFVSAAIVGITVTYSLVPPYTNRTPEPTQPNNITTLELKVDFGKYDVPEGTAILFFNPMINEECFKNGADGLVGIIEEGVSVIPLADDGVMDAFGIFPEEYAERYLKDVWDIVEDCQNN